MELNDCFLLSIVIKERLERYFKTHSLLKTKLKFSFIYLIKIGREKAIKAIRLHDNFIKVSIRQQTTVIGIVEKIPNAKLSWVRQTVRKNNCV